MWGTNKRITLPLTTTPRSYVGHHRTTVLFSFTHLSKTFSSPRGKSARRSSLSRKETAHTTHLYLPHRKKLTPHKEEDRRRCNSVGDRRKKVTVRDFERENRERENPLKKRDAQNRLCEVRGRNPTPSINTLRVSMSGLLMWDCNFRAAVRAIGSIIWA